MAKINNFISIRNKINQSLKKSRYSNFAYNAAQTRFLSAKEQLLMEFNEDVVNQEIEAGPIADNLTNSLDQGNTKHQGNLFSFIGFDKDAEPVRELREFIDDKIQLKNQPTFNTIGNRFNYNFPVKYPTMSQIEEFTRINKYASAYPNSRSWVTMVRNGIQGIGSYVYHEFFKKGSRSGTGIQDNRREDSGRSFKPISNYLIDIFNNFKSKFRT